MAGKYKEFWWRWFERIPGHEKIRAFYTDPIDPARPRYELFRAYGMFGTGAVLVALDILANDKNGVLVTIGVWLLLLGIWPIAKLAEYGIGRFVWVIVVIGTVLHFADSPTLAYFGSLPQSWIEYLTVAMMSGFGAGLLAGTAKLTFNALRPPIPPSDALSIDEP